MSYPPRICTGGWVHRAADDKRVDNMGVSVTWADRGRCPS